MPDDVTKRINYFDRQFLRAKDFQDEQTYHLDRRRRHNRLLHTYGIADDGLTVTTSSVPGEERMVLVSPGTAYDPQGNEIVLTVITPATAIKLDLASVGVNPGPPVSYTSPLYLTIAYDERPSDLSTDPGVVGYTRVLEEPKLEASATPPTDLNHLLVAVVNRDTSSGNVIAPIDPNPPGRLRAGALPPGSIGPVELADGSVQSRHIALGAISNSKIQDGSVTLEKIAAGVISPNIGIAVTAGMTNGATIPIPSGFTRQECVFFAYPKAIINRDVRGYNITINNTGRITFTYQDQNGNAIPDPAPDVQELFPMYATGVAIAKKGGW